MSEKTIKNLVETRKRVVVDVNQGHLSVNTGARILGISRQGFLKLRRKVNEHGLESVVGRKGGPKAYQRPHNRTDKWIEQTVERFFNLYGVGPDVWSGYLRTAALSYLGNSLQNTSYKEVGNT